MTNLDLYIKDLYDNYKDIFSLSKTGIIFIEPRYKDLNFIEIFSILKQKYSNLRCHALPNTMRSRTLKGASWLQMRTL